jgi:hypothetical protein
MTNHGDFPDGFFTKTVRMEPPEPTARSKKARLDMPGLWDLAKVME